MNILYLGVIKNYEQVVPKILQLETFFSILHKILYDPRKRGNGPVTTANILITMAKFAIV